jgi:hypothetical protein
MAGISKEAAEKTVTVIKESSLFQKILANNSTISSMRFIMVFGVAFILINWAVMIYLLIYKLTDGEGYAVLAVSIGSVSGGVIGLVTALAGSKAYQSKAENTK